VACVVVTYNPRLARLRELLQAVAPQVAELILVDNGSRSHCLRWLKGLRSPTLSLIELGTNKGIAAAQNVGLDAARRAGYSHTLLLDHDSVPSPTMVADLMDAIAGLGLRGASVAAVGPRYLDARQDNPPPFIRIQGLRLVRYGCPSPDTVVEVDYLIASGSLIPMASLEAVGGMAEELFIDYVDIEWGLRARRLGFQCYGVCGALMSHDLGEAPVNFLGRRLPIHSALRHYYHFRNAVWLYRSADLPLEWKVVDAWRLLLKYVFYTVFAKPRGEHFRMMTRGMMDGIRGRLGQLETEGSGAAGTRRGK
jgi:rhamnosyltransferase